MNYFMEWNASCVDPQLTELNVISLEGDRPLDYLLYADGVPRRNDGRVCDRILKRYNHLNQGGWWCSGVDILTGNEDMWGCFKPADPRLSSNSHKPIKYEHPPQTATGIFALRVSQQIWDAIVHRNSLTLSPEAIQPDRPDLGFWQWVIDHPEIPLCITEGAKKAGSLLTAGYAAIALPGINGGYRVPRDEWGNRTGKSYLIPELHKLATPGRQIYIVFDSDTKPNTIKAVEAAIGQMGYLLSRRGCNTKVITWNPKLGKGVDDLIATQGIEALHQAYKAATPLETWRAISYSRLTYLADLNLNCPYLPGDLIIPDRAKLVGIKSPKGSGKTQLLENIVKQACHRGQSVLVIGHRIRLVESLCQRFGLDYMKSAMGVTINPGEGYGLCIDSLHPGAATGFNPNNWSNTLVILDEVEQVIWHGLNSDTCRKYRVAILRSLKTLLQNVLTAKGQVVVADADLSDTTIDYLKALSGIPLTPFIVENHFIPTAHKAWNVYHYGGHSPKQLVKDLENHIASGGRPFVCLSAQKLASQWGTCTLEAYFKTQFPDLKILRIDSESLADPTHAASGCMDQLNQVLANYDMVLASPSIETGVSIDLKGHFTSVWAIAQGIQAENSVRQALGRVRENVPRHLWIASHGLNLVGNGALSMASLLTCGNRLTRLNIRLLQQSDFDGLDDCEIGFQAESLVCWGKMAVRFNATMGRYRESVLAGLEAEGHQLWPVSATGEGSNLLSQEVAKPSLGALIAAVRDRNYQTDCWAISLAPDLSDLEYHLLQKQMVKTLTERQSLRKYELKLRYGISVTADLVAKDDRGWYQQLRLHYFLTVGRSFLAGRDALIAHQFLHRGKGSLFSPDFNRSQLGAVVGTLELLGIPALLQHENRELKNTDSDLQEMAATALGDRPGIKSIMGIGLAKKSTPIMVLRRFLDKIGYGLKCDRIEKHGKKRHRVYHLLTPDDERQQVFQQWLKLESQCPGETPTIFDSPISLPTINNPEYTQLCLTLNPENEKVKYSP